MEIVADDKSMMVPVCCPVSLWKPWPEAYKLMLPNADTTFVEFPTVGYFIVVGRDKI